MFPIWSMTRCFFCWITFVTSLFLYPVFSRNWSFAWRGYPWRLK